MSFKRKIRNVIKRMIVPISPTLDTKLAYRSAFKKKLNLKDPKTINEKILYLKLNDYYKNDLIMSYEDQTIIDGVWEDLVIFKLEFEGKDLINLKRLYL